MPIPVVCANCQTRLNAPDAAAGKKVRCPKCQAIMAVPAAAAPPPPPPGLDNPFSLDPGAGASPPPPSARRSGSEPRPAPRPAAPPPPKPATPPAGGGGAFDFGAAVSSAVPARGPADRGRRQRDDEGASPPDRGERPRRRPRDDEPDDLEDDDRPRRGAGGGKKPPVLLIVLGLGFFLLTCCGGGGYGAYFAFNKVKEAAEKARAENDAKQKQIDDAQKKLEGGGGDAGGGGDTGGGGGKAAVPAGWTEFKAPDGSFRAYFPKTPRRDDPPTPAPKKGVPAPTMAGFVDEPRDGEYLFGAVVVKFAPSSPPAFRSEVVEKMTGAFGSKLPGAQTRDVTWLGQKGKEVTAKAPDGTGEVVIRQAAVGNTVYVGIAGNKNALRPELANGFFDNFEALSK